MVARVLIIGAVLLTGLSHAGLGSAQTAGTTTQSPVSTAPPSPNDYSDPSSGIAAKYPGDVGIERDPAVVFTENFERGSIEVIGKRWSEVSNKEGEVMALSNVVPPG